MYQSVRMQAIKGILANRLEDVARDLSYKLRNLDTELKVKLNRIARNRKGKPNQAYWDDQVRSVKESTELTAKSMKTLAAATTEKLKAYYGKALKAVRSF